MTSGAISCNQAIIGTNSNAQYGDKLVINSVLNLQQTILCSTSSCTAQQYATIKSSILSTLSSKTFTLNVNLNNETISLVTMIFCSFGTGK